MPILGLITACERSIIEQDTKFVSLINLFSAVKIALATTELPPANAVYPKDWSIALGWDGERVDEGKVFDQVMEINWPDGKPFVARNVIKFSVEVGKRHFQMAKFAGFPAGQAGKCLVQVWAELDGKPVTEKVSFPITIEHQQATQPQSP